MENLRSDFFIVVLCRIFLVRGEGHFSMSPLAFHKVEVKITLLGVLLRVEMSHTMGW